MNQLDPLAIFKQLDQMVGKGARYFLFIFGGFVVLFGLASETDADLASLTSGEFIAVIAVGAVLIALGALVSVYELKTIHAEARHIRELGQEQVKAGQSQTQTKAEREAA